MATGRLAASALTGNTLTTVYTVPASKVASFSVSATNLGSVNATFRLALASASTPANSEYIAYDFLITPGSTLEKTGLVLDAAKLVVAYSNSATISVVAYGYEEDA